MWRAFFLACGIFACIMGAECLVVDTFVMAGESTTVVQAPESVPATLFGSPPPPATIVTQNHKNVKPPEWAAWSLLSAGAVVILYSLTLNRGG
jgi:hypothetical protein